MASNPENTTSATEGRPAGDQGEPAVQHPSDAEAREAYQYWGYLYKPDKTGTDKLKSLLRGLKEVMNVQYEPSDCPDLTPTQLAGFYRDLHGNYDQLFLGTPSESIAFIYQSLGCLHSLQPLPHSTAFIVPTVPALKTEGWIMWQTIQLLLAPDEHSSFLVEAVQKWDVKDVTTGEVFPKILPRQCFPMEPDKHMVAWYEGVSERLRREAEEEERQREAEAQQAEVRRLHDRVRREDNADEDSSVDSRGPALAYFRNPLYRHVDGRPTIVRRNSKRPQLSPRPTSMMDRGKEAASTMGHVIRNVASPHLWDGRRPSKSHSRDSDRERRRRTSLPDNRFYDGPTSAGYDTARPSSELHRPSNHRRRSSHADRRSTASAEGEWDKDSGPIYPPGPDARLRHHHRDDPELSLRHNRSHDPTPNQIEDEDYFTEHDDPNQRRNSAHGTATPPVPSNGMGPSFGPSASPLFASHVAKQPQPQSRVPPPDAYGRPQRSSNMRHSHGRPYSRSPEPPRSRTRDDRSRTRDDRSQTREERDQRRYNPPRRSRYDRSPPSGYDSNPPNGPPPMGQHHHSQSGYSPGGGPRDRRSGRMSSSDVSAHSGPEDQEGRRSGPKQTRLASGVDGRRYPNENLWR